MRGSTREGNGGKCAAEPLEPQVSWAKGDSESAGQSHRIANCSAKGDERVWARNYIFRQNTIVHKVCSSTLPAQNLEHGPTARTYLPSLSAPKNEEVVETTLYSGYT